MILSIISVGNQPSSWEQAGIEYYTKQFPKELNLKLTNVKGQQHPKRSKEEVLKLESKLISSKIDKNSYIVSWDSKGEKLNNDQLSKFFEQSMLENRKLDFIIGGSFGIPKDILKKSNKIISVSNFTFPHRLFKIILIEQIYRSFSIINKLPYHK
jgi:23S rRNA (pseudouridine1915-N3)-methyltransferase|tara:strand:- start:37 stop:501 length:465 start_codon:yes stop_codon:yes gene_type:complete